MAEGLSKTIQSGSEADVEVSCAPCEEDGSIKRAMTYCSTCDQHFCKACSKCHALFQATKTHTVTDVLSKSWDRLNYSKAIRVAKCTFHPNRNIEMYCGQHDMVFCALCVAVNHRTCSGVVEVTNAQTPKINQSELQSLKCKIDDLQKQFQESKERKIRNLKHLDSSEPELKEEIENEYRLLIQHIDKLRECALTCLKETSEQVFAHIKKEIREADGMETTLQRCMSHVSSSDTSSNSQTFIQYVLARNNVCKAENLLSGLNSYESKHIEVDVNRSIHNSVLSATNIAQPRENTVEFEYDSRNINCTWTSQAGLEYEPVALGQDQAGLEYEPVALGQDQVCWETSNLVTVQVGTPSQAIFQQTHQDSTFQQPHSSPFGSTNLPLELNVARDRRFSVKCDIANTG